MLSFVGDGFSLVWLVWFGLVWFGLVGFVWFGLVWYCLVCYGLDWFGVVGMVWVIGVVWVVVVGGMVGVVRVVEDVVEMNPVFFNIHGYAEIGCLVTFGLV